jgi:hypothetical protein
MSYDHPLHVAVGNFLQQLSLPPGCDLLLAPECGGTEGCLPLFCSATKSNATQFCEADAIILKAGKICFTLEIEESCLRPTNTFGKFFQAACCTHLSILRPLIATKEAATFVQVLDSTSLKFPTYGRQTTKPGQGRNIEQAIQRMLPLGDFVKYRLFYFRGTRGFHLDDSGNLASVVLAACGATAKSKTA